MSKGIFKILKTLTRLLAGLIILTVALIILIPVATYFFFDPNQYRPQIASFITQKTGLPLAINGQIDFQLFPGFGLKVQKVDLLPPTSKIPFIQIEEIGFQIPLKELIRSHFQIEALTIKGMQVNLIRQANGTANWEYLSHKINKTSPEQAKISQEPATNKNATKQLDFNITNFNLENATIYYQDQQENQLIVLDKLYLEGKSEKELIYPVKGKFELVLQAAREKKSLIKGNGEFNGKALLASKTLMANLQTHFIGQTFAFAQQPLQLSSQIEINPAAAISFKGLEIKIGQTHATGNLKIPVDSQAPITFNVIMNKLNLDQLHLAQKKSSSQVAYAPEPEFKLVAAPKKSIPAKSANPRVISGDVQINDLMVKNITLTNVKSQVKKVGPLLKIDILAAKFYQGILNGSLSKDLENSQASAYFQGKVNGTQIEPLLKDLKSVDKLTGVAAVTFNMSYQPLQGFNGVTHFQIKQGTFKGIDVYYYLVSAQSLLKKEVVTVANTKLTPFDDLSGTLNFSNNLVNNPDLQISSVDFKGSGQGSINLNTQAIAYKLQALRQYHDDKEHPNAYPLALRIRGTIDHPIVEPDLDLYFKEALKREATKQINKQLEKKLGKILGVDKAEQQNTQEGVPDNRSTTKEQLQEKIEKEVGRGLKKVLGL